MKSGLGSIHGRRCAWHALQCFGYADLVDTGWQRQAESSELADGTKTCTKAIGKLTLAAAPHHLGVAGVLQLLLVVLVCGLGTAGPVLGDTLKVDLRKRVAPPTAPDKSHIVCETQQWDPSETAIVICDMWNQHWCQGATQRVAELAPVMNQVVAAARDKGVLIVHSPSGTIDHYKDHPARLVAMNAPKAANLPAGITSWCQWKDETEKKAGYPIDHSDGGCDCQPQCKQGSPWTSQIAAIEIKDKDAISDSGAEVWNLLEARGIKNVILMGVHANMCVLGRPFGLRNLAKAGKNVVLMRDLTDTMYNSRQPPQVNHFTGTDLIVEHTEKYVCPTIVSTVFTGKPPFRFKDDKRPVRRVPLGGERVRRGRDSARLRSRASAQSRPALRDRPGRHGHQEQRPALHQRPGNPDQKPTLAVVFARRRALPTDQMKYLRDYLDRGGPLIGLRTASHAFDAKGTGPKEGHEEWPKFDPEVLGGNYHNHYGAGPKLTVTPVARSDQPSDPQGRRAASAQ